MIHNTRENITRSYIGMLFLTWIGGYIRWKIVCGSIAVSQSVTWVRVIHGHSQHAKLKSNLLSDGDRVPPKQAVVKHIARSAQTLMAEGGKMMLGIDTTEMQVVMPLYKAANVHQAHVYGFKTSIPHIT